MLCITMDEFKKILLAAVVAIAIIVGTVAYSASSLTAAASYPTFRNYQDFSCGPGYRPLLKQETRYGTGKMVIVDCIAQDAPVVAWGNTFPSVGQRWKLPPR